MLPVDIALDDPASFSNGHPVDQYARLHENGPVAWHPRADGSGFWAATGYDAVREVSHDPRTYSSNDGVGLDDRTPAELKGMRRMMLHMDPPDHTRYRRLVAAGFTRRSADEMQAMLRSLAADIIDDVIDAGGCDFVPDIAGKLPSYVIARLMGIPREDGVMLYERTETIHASLTVVTPEARTAAGAEIAAYARQVAEEKRRRPGDDLSSRLLAVEIDGERLSDLEFVSFFILLINAGGDTTRNALGAGLLALLEHRDEFGRLEAEPSRLLPTAVEELVRWTSPVVHMRRTARRPVELCGHQVEAGQKVVMFYGAANRDPSHFDGPDRFDVARSPNDHVAFSAGGTHFCLGAHLARMEISVMVEQIVTRLRDIELAGEPQWSHSTFICGPSQIPITFRTR